MPRVTRTYAAAYWRLGDWHLNAGRLDEAHDWYRRSADVDPRAAGAWLGIVQVHLQRGEAEIALPIIDRLLDESPGGPNDAFLHQLRAAAYRVLGRHDVARNEAARAEAEQGRAASPIVDDQRAAALAALRTGYMEETERGLALAEAGRYREAIVVFERMRQRLGEDRGILNNLGLALLRAGDPVRAVEILERAVALDPGFQPSTKNLALASGHAATTSDDLAAAFVLIDRAIETMPSDAAAYEVKAFLHLRRGETVAAIDAYENSAERAPGNLAVAIRLATLLRAQGRATDAIGCCRRAMTAAGGRVGVDLLVLLASAHMDVGELTEAEAVLVLAADVDGADVDSAILAARARLETLRSHNGE